MGQFDAHQTRIESLKKPEAPDKLKQSIESKSSVLTTAVDQGETVLENAAKDLKTPKAKAYLGKAAGEVSAILSQIAQHGFSILQDKNKVDTAVASIDALVSNLSKKLSDQARIIGEFKSYEEKEKQVDEFVKAEKEKTATGDKFIAAERDLNNAKKAVPPKSKDEISALQRGMDDLRGQYVAKMKGLNDLYEPFKQPGYLASMESEVYETFYKLRTEKFAPAETSYKKSLEGLELIEKEQGRTESNAEIEGVKEATIKLEVEMQQYAALVEELNANWPAADPEKKKDCESREQALLSAYSAAKTTLDQIKAKSDKDEIHWIDPADLAAAAKPVTDNIKKIESYKTERSLRARIGDDSKYLTFYTNEEGFRSYKENTTESGKIKTWDEHNVIFRNIKNHLSDARAEVKKETQKAEMDAMLKGSKDKREALENKLGEKGKKYFEALTALQAGDSEKAATLLTQYKDQKFTEEELTLHAGLIEQAKEQLETINQSKAFYAAMGLIKGGDQKGGVTQLNAYLASVVKLPPDKKSAHEGQIEAAKETIKGIGLSNVNLMADVFDDMVKLRIARRKMGGGHLRYSESMEDEYYKTELDDLREKIMKGECLDPFTEIAAARKRVEDKVKAKVEDVDWKQEDSLLTEAQDLFDAMHNMDPKAREKALVDFAKRARGERAYDLARKYLERALEPMYQEFEQKVNKGELQKYMLSDPKISAWLKENAKARYDKMKKENNLAGLTYDDVYNQLVQFKMQDVMRKEMRRQMTSEGLAGANYQAAAKGSMLEKMVANHQIIFQPTRFQSLTMTEGTSEALLLYNEYFKGEDSEWYNPTTWGAEDWDDFEDATISFAFDTVMSLGIGVGAGAVGKAAGKAVVKALLKRGVSRAAIAAIEKGGISALREVIKGEAKGVLKAYLARQAATIAAEGATMFTLGTIQSGVMDPINTAQQFSAWWQGPSRLGEAMVKTAMYRVVGAAGARFLGNNPAIWKEITEHVGSGIVGEGVEYLGLAARGEAGGYTAKDFARGMIQDAFQAGGRKIGSGVRRGGQMSQGEIRARKAAAEHDLDAIGAGTPDKIGGVEVRRHKQDGVEVVEYVVRGEKGARVFRADDMSVLSPEVRRRIEGEATKSESATPKVSPPGEKPKEQGPYRTPAEASERSDTARAETPADRSRREAARAEQIQTQIKARESALDSTTEEGRKVDTSIAGKKTEVEVKLPDGTTTKVEIKVEKSLLTPETLHRLAQGEPLQLSPLDQYLHQHMGKGIRDAIAKHITENPTLETRRQELETAAATGDFEAMKRIMGEEGAGKLKKAIDTVREKTAQGMDIFTRSHTDVNPDGVDVSRQPMSETIDKTLNEYADEHFRETGERMDPQMLAALKERMLKSAIDQQIDNPPEYVSHGFDHSLRVMDHVERVLKGNPEAIAEYAKKYDISHAQAKMMMKMVGIAHDFGYPLKGDLNKSIHALTGTHHFLAEFARPMANAMGLDLSNPKHQKAIKNLANAIEKHSADKIEGKYKDSAGKKKPLEFDRKIVVEIKVTGTDMTYQQELLISSATLQQYPNVTAYVRNHFKNLDIQLAGGITVVHAPPGQKFYGRHVDLPGTTQKGEIPAGVEYTGADLMPLPEGVPKPSRHTDPNTPGLRYKHDPLLALIRYSDNMDMAENRFSDFQKSTPFRRLYERLGVERAVNLLMGEKTVSSALADSMGRSDFSVDRAKIILEKAGKPGKPQLTEGELLSLTERLTQADTPEQREQALVNLRNLVQSVDIVSFGRPPKIISAEYKQIILQRIETSIQNPGMSPKDHFKGMRDAIGDRVLNEEAQGLSPEDTKHLATVRRFLGTVDAVSYRHFGGCRPIGDVAVNGSTMRVEMKPDVMMQYRGYVAGEGPGVNVPVNVYQIWRGIDAANSLTIGGKSMKLEIAVNINGVEKVFKFDPSKVEEGKSISAEFVRQYKEWESISL